LACNGKSLRVSVDGRVMVNDPDLAVRAAADALRICYTREALAEPFPRSGPLMQVLENWSPSFKGLSLDPLGHRQVPATLRALIDMIRAAGSSTLGRRLREKHFATG
jgi:DNA-binding transcriptional LysR family regulator